MANQGVPQGGKYPSRQELGALFKSFLGDTTDLRMDRRYLYGQQANRIYTDNLDATKDEGFYGSGTYIRPDYDMSPNPGYANTNPATDDIINAAGGATPRFVEWDIPTSSTNYARPRTVAAGYDEDNQVMTVVFRDGTFYNYYQVSPTEWEAFHASYSKGRPWLNKKNSKQPGDGLFIHKPRGEATDLSTMDPRIREALVRVANTHQQKTAPKAGRTKQVAPLYSSINSGKPGKIIGTMEVKNRPKNARANKGPAHGQGRTISSSAKGNRKAS